MHRDAWPYQTQVPQKNASPDASCVVVHKQTPFHLYDSANGTKTTANIVEEFIDTSEVDGKAQGGYCTTLSGVITLKIFFRHQVSGEGAGNEHQRNQGTENNTLQ